MAKYTLLSCGPTYDTYEEAEGTLTTDIDIVKLLLANLHADSIYIL